MFVKDQAYALQREGNETPELVRIVIPEGGIECEVYGNSDMDRVLVQGYYNLRRFFWAEPDKLSVYTGAKNTKYA